MNNHQPRFQSNTSYGEVLSNQAEPLEPNTLIFEDEKEAKGFTSVPNHILRNPSISAAAKAAYTLLLSYAWREGNCFPGQQRLAQDFGLSIRHIRRYLAELIEHDLIKVVRRGLGKTNVYIIRKMFKADGTWMSHQERTSKSHQDRTPMSYKEYSGEKDSVEEHSDTSKFRKAMSLEKNNDNRLKDKGLLTENSLSKKENLAQNEGFSSGIAHVLKALSYHDLHDPTHIKSNVTRAQNLSRKSHLSEPAFLSLVAEAKKITFNHYGTIRKDAGYLGLKNQAPYFFKVLENLVHQKTLDRFRKHMVEQKSFG